MALMSRANTIWSKFSELPGAAVGGWLGIASEHAIGGLIWAVERYRPRRVLELGGGIGTLTFTLAETLTRTHVDNWSLFTVENNPFCCGELVRNVSDAERLTLISDTSEIAEADRQFDLIVVDGGGDLGGDMGIMDFSGMLRPGGMIFVEGHRAFQRGNIEKWYAERPVFHLSSRPLSPKLTPKNPEHRAKNKGFHLYVFEPTAWDRKLLTARGFLSDIGVRAYRRLAAWFS